jgi:hypothetical protein
MSIRQSIIFFLLVSVLTACNLAFPNPNNETPDLPTTPPTSLPFPTDLSPTSPSIDATTPVWSNQTILDRASDVVQTLKSQDFISLASYVHPVNGVRFSPYAFVQEANQVLSVDEVASIMSNSSVYTWGAYSGTGETINLGFPDYYSKFIYDEDFANAPQVALNHRLSSGNSIDNSAEYYPGSMIIEYYFPGFDPQYGGMDWRSLRLVFSEYNSIWYLVGIIHDEWTP